MVGQRRDRGQLLLIAAIVVATAVLGSVVLLNTVHSSPDVAAQTDANSLSETERTATELEGELEKLFLSTHSVEETGEPLPYVSRSAFGDVVSSYAEVYNRLVTSDRPAVASIEYVESEAVAGAVAYDTDPDTTPNDPVHLLDGVDEGTLPLFSVSAAGIDGTLSVEFNDTDTGDVDASLNLTSEEVTYPNDGTPLCEVGSEASVELRHGVGEISTDEAFCGGVVVDYPDFDELVIRNGGGVDRLQYTVSAAGANCAETDDCVDGEEIDVNPTFGIELSDPSVTYDATVRPYEVSDG